MYLCIQLSDDTKADKSKKKKRLDDIMFGLGAAKGLSLDKEKAAAAAPCFLDSLCQPQDYVCQAVCKTLPHSSSF